MSLCMSLVRLLGCVHSRLACNQHVVRLSMEGLKVSHRFMLYSPGSRRRVRQAVAPSDGALKSHRHQGTTL